MSGQNINLISSQGINIEAGKIAGTGQVNMQAAGLLPPVSAEAAAAGEVRSSIRIDGLLDEFKYGREGSNDYEQVLFNRPSEISGRSGVSIAAPSADNNNRLIISASNITAPNGKITLQAYGDILLKHGQEGFYTYHHGEYTTSSVWRKKHHVYTNEQEEMRPVPVKLSGQKGIDIKSGQNIVAYASDFTAPAGAINITASNALSLFAVDHISEKRNESSSSRKFLHAIKVSSSSHKSSSYVKDMLPA